MMDITTMSKPRRYPENLDMIYAYAAYEILEDRGSEDMWQVIDKWVDEVGQTRVLQDVSLIMDCARMGAEQQAQKLTLWQATLNRRNVCKNESL